MSQEHHGVLNHHQLNALLKSLFLLTMKKHPGTTLLAFCEWNPATASNAEDIFLYVVSGIN